MTDLATTTTPQAGESAPPEGGPAAETTSSGGSGDSPTYAWAPEEPAPKKKRHLGLWIGIPVGIVALGVAVASLVLIAPGTAVAGVPVGGLTVGSAADALNSRLAATTVKLQTPNGVVTMTGAELGASVDAKALADSAFADRPMWNVTQWNSAPIAANVSLDTATAASALRKAAGSLYTAPVDAKVSFDQATASYVVTPGTDGTGLDLEPVRAALQDAFTKGMTTVEAQAPVVPVTPTVTTDTATTSIATLNKVLDTVGFYVGSERTVPVDRAVAASWLTVAERDGQITVSADASAIQKFVDTLPGLVDRAPVNQTAVTNSSGEVLQVITAGVTGRSLGDTAGIANAFAGQLAAGNPVYPLTVSETPFQTTALYRHIDVNLSTQHAVLYENGAVVQDWAISSGLADTPTPTGNFTVFAHVRIQDMGCTPTSSYCTKDVPWVTYFAPDIAFHGAYWHNNFGTPMSHGCLNMPISEAQYVYDWAPEGTEVSVHF